MAPRRLARVGLFAAALLVAGCGAGASAQIDAAGSWQRLPDPPLSPREFAVGVWTGRRALIFGGSDAPPTHPSSSGPEMRKPPLRDGAAFDPRTGSWRRIAVAPSGIEPLSPVASAGDSVYVAVPRNPGSRDTRMDVLAYRTRTDSWDRLPSSPRRNFAIVAIGDRLVASGPGRGPRPLSVFLLGRGERRWKELPRPPVRGAVTWNGRRLVVIGFDPAARDYRNPPLARAATLKLGDDAWRRLPDADHVLWGHGFWVRVGSRLVSPELGTGGPEYSFGRPYGGILDPQRGTWSDLPNVEGLGGEFGTGVLTRARLVGGLPSQLVLDMSRGDWIRVPRLWRTRDLRQGLTAVNTRRKLLLFGGARWNRTHPEGELLNHAWLWTPPSD